MKAESCRKASKTLDRLIADLAQIISLEPESANGRCNLLFSPAY
jgi:hypothetical protein